MANAAPQLPQYAASESLETQELAQSDCHNGQLPVTREALEKLQAELPSRAG
jgi:hypothetical protein